MTENFADIVDEYIGESISEGDVVTGQVHDVVKNAVMIDFNFKSLGVIPKKEFDEDIEVGQDIDVVVSCLDDGRGQAILSREKAVIAEGISTAERIVGKDERVPIKILNEVGNGYAGIYKTMNVFIPKSLFRSSDTDVVNKKIDCKIVRFDREALNIIASYVDDSYANLEDPKGYDDVEIGDEIKGRINSIKPYGIFVNIGKMDALAHISDIEWGYLPEITSYKEGEEATFIVVQKENGRISLGAKQLNKEPLERLVKKSTTGPFEAEVKEIKKKSIIVEVDGIEGIVFDADINVTNFGIFKKSLDVGNIINVFIKNIDEDRGQVFFEIHDNQENVDDFMGRLDIGSMLPFFVIGNVKDSVYMIQSEKIKMKAFIDSEVEKHNTYKGVIEDVNKVDKILTIKLNDSGDS